MRLGFMHRFALSETKRRDRLGFVHRLGIETPKQADASRIHAPRCPERDETPRPSRFRAPTWHTVRSRREASRPERGRTGKHVASKSTQFADYICGKRGRNAQNAL